jgi:hypothetical protein
MEDRTASDRGRWVRLFRRCEEVSRLDVMVVRAGTAIIKTSSELVVSIVAVAPKGDPDQTKTELQRLE